VKSGLDKERHLDEVRAKLDAAMENPECLTPQQIRSLLRDAHQRAMRAAETSTRSSQSVERSRG
jgi:hypothetical protein